MQVTEHAKVSEQLKRIVDHFKRSAWSVPAVCTKFRVCANYLMPLFCCYRLDIVGYPVKRLPLSLLVQDCGSHLYFCLKIVFKVDQPDKLWVFLRRDSCKVCSGKLAARAFGF